MLYLDHHTASPLRKGVLACMQAAAQSGGNASSLHALGRTARRVVARASAALCTLAGDAAAEVIYCGSYAEAQTLAVVGLAEHARQAVGRCAVVLAPAMWRCAPQLVALLQRRGFAVARLEAEGNGNGWGARLVHPHAGAAPAPVQSLTQLQPSLVVWRPADPHAAAPVPDAALWAAAQAAGAQVVADAALAAGRQPLQMQAWGLAALVLASAPVGGPPGVAAVLLRPGIALTPLWGGGGQQNNRRSGTEALPLVAGLGEAAAQAAAVLEPEQRRLAKLRDALCAGWPQRLVPVPALPNLAVAPTAAVAPQVQALAAQGLMVGWGHGPGAPGALLSAWAAARTPAHLAFALGHTTSEATIAASRRVLTALWGPPMESACALSLP